MSAYENPWDLSFASSSPTGYRTRAVIGVELKRAAETRAMEARKAQERWTRTSITLIITSAKTHKTIKSLRQLTEVAVNPGITTARVVRWSLMILAEF